MRYRTAPGREHQPPDPAAERRYPITVELTAREITALIGQRDTSEMPVAVCVTSADNKEHRVNYAESALRKFKAAVQQQRP